MKPYTFFALGRVLAAMFASMLLLVAVGCYKTVEYTPSPLPTPVADDFIRGADLSFLPQIRQNGTTFADTAGIAADALDILKANGCNTVRLRLWHTPADGHSGLAEVVAFAKEVKSKGLRVWLDIHYADTWADPSQQPKPAAWAATTPLALGDSVAEYTTRVVKAVEPDVVQVGNEINGGFLWQTGNISNPTNFTALLKRGITAVRNARPTAKVMIHYAGTSGAEYFYNLLAQNGVEYDLIGISYYPQWHGKSIDSLHTALAGLHTRFGKPIVIAETAYPFTLGWADYTNNVVGLSSQIIPTYPATPNGQKAFLLAVRNAVAGVSPTGGFCYWSPDWVAYRGATATNGSSWENQALFDFNRRALPAVAVFAK